MGLNLTIDQGNSSAKIAIWEGGNLVEQETMKELTRQHLVKMVGRFHPERALCCSVTGNGRRMAQWLVTQGVDAREEYVLPRGELRDAPAAGYRLCHAANAW